MSGVKFVSSANLSTLAKEIAKKIKSAIAAAAAENDGKFLTEAQVSAKISDAVDSLIDGAPEAYDTLREIADALNKDVEGSVTNAIINTLAQKASISDFEEFTDAEIDEAAMGEQ